jgi:hypothetical protein
MWRFWQRHKIGRRQAEEKCGRSQGLHRTEKGRDTHPAWMAALRTQCWWQGAPSWGLSSSRPAWSPGKGREIRTRWRRPGIRIWPGKDWDCSSWVLKPYPQRSTSCVAESMFNDCPSGKPRAKGFQSTPSLLPAPPQCSPKAQLLPYPHPQPVSNPARQPG